MCVYIVGNRLEILQELLGLIDDVLIFKDRAVVGKVDSGRLRGQLAMNSLSVGMSLAECLESCDSLCSVE